MKYTKKEQLTIWKLKKGEENVSIEDLKSILLRKPSNVVYCELEGKLVGVISTGDILRAYKKKQDTVIVNSKFTYLHYGEYIKGRMIFKDRNTINALPVVTRDCVLIGDYTRWDDLLVLEHLIKVDNGRCIQYWRNEKKIVLVRPGRFCLDRERIFELLNNYLNQYNVVFQCIDCLEIFQYLKNADMFLFVDENEIRACDAILKLMYGDKYEGQYKLKTYKNFLSRELDFSDEDCVWYLKKLQDQGIRIIGFIFEESVYHKKLLKTIEDRFASVDEVPSTKLPRSMYKDFFDDLYSEKYADSIMNMPLSFENNGGVLRLRDCKSQFYNVVNGERNTTNQPVQYERSIYFFGQCYIYGHYVEDKNTIESLLQRHICQNDRTLRVVNCGSLGTYVEHRYLPRIATTQLKKGDIIAIDCAPKGISGIHYLDFNQVLEKNNVGAEWLVDDSFHCNHKVNKLFADAIYDVLVPILYEEIENQGELIDKDEDFIKFLYIDRYFADFSVSNYDRIGSIVMNCNPFTLGHRYLIEQALKTIDFLIIFVVEEDKSFFSFSERLAMVREGVADLENLMVVPSGPFILSQMSFPEYFIKEKSKDIENNTIQDIKTFAKKIAPQLGIRYRFFGEEPLDEVTNEYNVAMKRELPRYGIEAVEIPRKSVEGKAISASWVRKCFDENNIGQLEKLLPESTRNLLGLV